MSAQPRVLAGGEYERRAREDWARKNLRPAVSRPPRGRPTGDRYPGQVIHHTCGVSKHARLTCEPCRIEKTFKDAVVTAVLRVPRSPLKLVRLEYAEDEDNLRYAGDEGMGWRLEFRARLAPNVGDVVRVRWAKKPRARRWRLEVVR